MRPQNPHEESDDMATDQISDIDDLRAEIDRLEAARC